MTDQRHMKHLGKAATALHEVYQERWRRELAQRPHDQLNSLGQIQKGLEQEARKLQRLASCTGFAHSHQIATELFSRQRRYADQGRQICEALIGNIDRGLPQIPSFRELFDELAACQHEFGEVSFDLDDGSITVDTGEITLEGTYLGPFELNLGLASMLTMSPEQWVRCQALDPNHATSNDAVTHPHVNQELLCMGDAGPVVFSAFVDGRICDAFVLIRSTLQTYNPESAYVSLEDWEGIACSECGESVPYDEAHYVEGCDCQLCDHCLKVCPYSDKSGCASCFTHIERTDEWVHPTEATTCECCLSQCTYEEIDENHYCESCQEEYSHDEDTEQDTEPEDEDDSETICNHSTSTASSSQRAEAATTDAPAETSPQAQPQPAS